MAKGKKTGGGSRAGKPNKATADIKALAQLHAAAAITTLAEIMGDAQQPAAARVAASDKLLDRGFGKAAQSVALSGGDTPVQVVAMTREEILAEVGKVCGKF